MAIRTQRRSRDRAAPAWAQQGLAGLAPVVEAVLAEAAPGVGMVVDIGAGTGAIAVPLAATADRVVAVDVSRAMLGELERFAARDGIGNIEVRPTSIEAFDLPCASVDLVVSNYALHQLLGLDKQIFVERAASWLRPGGKLVIGDMMFGRGSTAEDRAIIASKVRVMLSRGPSGWWRITRNGWRFFTRTSQRPIPLAAWVALLRHAGLVDVSGRRVVAEAAVVTGRRPAVRPARAAGRAR